MRQQLAKREAIDMQREKLERLVDTVIESVCGCGLFAVIAWAIFAKKGLFGFVVVCAAFVAAGWILENYTRKK